jgi:hypothetical protein
MDDLKVTRKNAIEAQCHECLGHYTDGKQDCGCVRCPLYSFMPYAEKEPVLDWTRFHPRRVGKILLSGLQATSAQKKAGARLQSLRGGKGRDDG